MPPLLPAGTCDARYVHRRRVLIGLAAGAAALRASSLLSEQNPLPALESRYGGRLGVFALDTRTGRQLLHRADERFLMCSMFKLPLAAAVLARVDAGQLKLTDRIEYSGKDLPGYAPVTQAHVRRGSLSVKELCSAAVEMSDNGAANLLLAKLGGPAALTGFARAHGDTVTRFDRTELSLNYPSGEMDTTTPRAFVGLVQTMVLGDVLKPESRRLLRDWMIACETGKKRLRAGLPRGWLVGDKTGTAGPETNDTAVIWPAARSPVLVSALYEAVKATDDEREGVLREVGTVVTNWLRGN